MSRKNILVTGAGTAIYKVAVKTGDLKNAGTDAKVCLNMFLHLGLLYLL